MYEYVVQKHEVNFLLLCERLCSSATDREFGWLVVFGLTAR